MIYLDSAATLPPTDEVVLDYVWAATKYPYNPSSVYSVGKEARKILEESRLLIAQNINCDPEEVFFTSGGTEGNNMIVKGWRDGVLAKKGIRKRAFITSPIEHPSILEPAHHDFDDRFSVYYTPVFKDGTIDLSSFKETMKIEKSEGGNDLDMLVSIQFANNEIGTVQDIAAISALTHRYGGFFHTDAVQAFPHFNIDVKTLDIDAMTVSGHKFGAPRGTGFMYISKDLQNVIFPMIRGGLQEMGFRAGTENVAGFYALANQVNRLCYDEDYSACEYLIDRLNETDLDFYQNGRPDIGICSLTFPGVRTSELVTLLSEDGIYASTGSACHNYSPVPSHVLKSIGLSDEEAKSTMRVCLDGVMHGQIDILVDKLTFYIGLLKG